MLRSPLFLLSLVVAVASYLKTKDALGFQPELRAPTEAMIIASGLLAAISLRELGRVVAGATHGMRLGWMTVGPLTLTRRDGRLRPGLTLNPVNWTDRAFVVPPSDDATFDESVRRLFVTTAGGPVASALGMLVGLGIGAAADAEGTAFFGWALAAASAFVLTHSMFVPDGPSLVSDLGMLRRLWPWAEDAELAAALATVQGHDHAGIRPAQWPAGLIATLERTVDDSPTGLLVRASILPLRRWDLGEKAGALADVEELLEGDLLERGPLRDAVVVSVASMRASVHGDAKGARALLEAEGALDRVPPGIAATALFEVLRAEDAAPEAIAARRQEALAFYLSVPRSGSVDMAIEELCGPPGRA